jgi:hypothetical protein
VLLSGEGIALAALRGHAGTGANSFRNEASSRCIAETSPNRHGWCGDGEESDADIFRHTTREEPACADTALRFDAGFKELPERRTFK